MLRTPRDVDRVARLLHPYVEVGIAAHIRNLKISLSALRNEWLERARSRPQYVRSWLIGLGIVAALPTVGLVSYFIDLQEGLPDKEAIARIGQMDQATAVYDDRDQLAFTIFKEQRMDARCQTFLRTSSTRSSPSKISGSTITAASTSAAWRLRRSPTFATAAPRRAAARSRSSSRGRAS